MRNGKFAYSALLLAVGCLAQEPAPYLASIRGGVTVSRPAGERAKAGKNMALAAGDLVATGLHSRADVRLDPAVWLRLEANGELRMAQLEAQRYRIELARGAVTCYVDNAPAREIQVGTPSVGVRPSSPGVYRIAVNKAGESEILARQGELEVFSPSGSQAVAAGQKLIARGDAANPEFKIVSGVSRWSRVFGAFGEHGAGSHRRFLLRLPLRFGLGFQFELKFDLEFDLKLRVEYEQRAGQGTGEPAGLKTRPAGCAVGRFGIPVVAAHGQREVSPW